MPIKAKDCCSLNVELTKFAEFHESVLFFFHQTPTSLDCWLKGNAWVININCTVFLRTRLLFSFIFFFRFTILLKGLFYHVLFSSRFQNEEILKKATTDYQEKLKKSEEKYRLLKKHAEEKIERFVFVICTLAYGKQILSSVLFSWLLLACSAGVFWAYFGRILAIQARIDWSTLLDYKYG